jgi:leader peptidase (prepilin peptidase) / N-methyltransferase
MTRLMLLPPAIADVFVVAFGLLVGSFLNVCIYRLPRKESIAFPASRCPHCGHALAWYENVPVLSYAVLRGRCYSCRAPIAIRYPIVELLTGGLFLWHWWLFGWTPLFAVRLAFACSLLVLFAIDLEHQILPDVITLPGIVAGFACSLFLPPGPILSLAGIVAGGGILWLISEVWFRIRKVDAMGFGDVKMLAMVGAFLGVKLVVLVFVLSSMLGGFIGVVLIVARRADRATKLPFGTMLAAASLFASLYGDRLIAWYTSMFALQ